LKNILVGEKYRRSKGEKIWKERDRRKRRTKREKNIKKRGSGSRRKTGNVFITPNRNPIEGFILNKNRKFYISKDFNLGGGGRQREQVLRKVKKAGKRSRKKWGSLDAKVEAI